MATAEENARGTTKKTSKGGGSGNGQGSGRLGAAFGKQRGPTAERGWDECDPRHVMWVLVAIGALGGAVTYGRSRDKAALSVTLLLDGERETVWIAPEHEIEVELAKIAERLEALA